MKQSILFLTCANSEYPVQLEVARKLKEHKFRVIFCFNAIANDLNTEMQKCMNEGFDLLEIFGKNTFDGADSNRLTTHRRKNHDIEKGKITLHDLCKTYNHRKSAINSFKDLLKDLEIDMIILSNNKFVFLIPYLIRAAHLEDKIVIFLPFGMESLKTYHIKLNDAPLDGTSNWNVFSFVFKQWTIQAPNGKRKLGISVIELLVMTLLSASPEYPTSPYGGNVDYIFAENEYMHNFYKNLISKKSKLINTGTPNNDVLYEASKDKRTAYYHLCKKYGVPNDRSLILVSLPQYISSFWIHVKEYDSYLAFVRSFFFDLSLAGNNHNIFISIHPRMHKTLIHEQAEPLKNIIITEEYIAHLIPLCEFYVCCESSTIRMAIACNKPIINYDFYSFNYDLFTEELGVMTVKNENAFVNALISFCGKNSTFWSYIRRQKHILDQFGPINGCAVEKIVQKIFDIINEHPP